MRGAYPLSLTLLSLNTFITALPNLAAFIGRANHRVALKRFGEGGHVRERPVDTELSERVRVIDDSLARGLGAYVLRPHLRPTEEEALLRRKTCDCFRTRLAFERLLVGRVSDGQAAEVGDRLADDELAYLMQSRLDLESVELLDDAVRPLVELLEVFVRPPLHKVAVGVELRARIVEAVTAPMPP